MSDAAMKSVPRFLPPLTILGAVLSLAWAASATTAAPPKPAAPNALTVLKNRCGACHSGSGRKGDLDLTTPEGIAKGGEGGAVVVPGKPDESRLLKVLLEGKMPPKGLPRLSAAEINTIRAWIASSKPTTAVAVIPLSQHKIVPLMALRCTVCHGLRRQEGGLDLRTRASMLKGGKSGPAIVLGKPEESLVLKRIHSGEMPPPRELVAVSVKPMEPSEVDLLSRWIAAGAPEVEIKPEIQGAPDPLVTDVDRRFWAFRPPKASQIPKTKSQSPNPNPIDAFLLAELEKKGLGFAPEADRSTLIRRATYDLTGLPPTPEEVTAFLADKQPGAYERLIDRLLASPRYGERWARKWMDLAGYSDTEGIQDGDPARPFNWRYRDYLIRAFNADKPYDRFILEQIAGDELADYEKGPVTQEIADNLTATGFLRQAVDATFAGITGFVPDRLDVIADEVNVLGSSVMGLTLKCARCHSHKFDPIPQRDYFRLTDIFKGALDENDWLSPQLRDGSGRSVAGSRHLTYVSAEERAAWEQSEAALTAEAAEVRKPVEALLAKLRSEGQTGDEGALQAKNPELAAAIRERDLLLGAIERRHKPMPIVRALWDRGDPSPTYLYQRGDYLRPSIPIAPGVPSVLTDGKTPFTITPPWPGAKQTGRRLAFARWLVRPDNPLTSRVIVNRIWKQHFGRGIVTTLDNFGKTGARPSHPELLDTLSVLFTTETRSHGEGGMAGQRDSGTAGLGWSLKRLHRLMMLSRAYRQASHMPSNQQSSISNHQSAIQADPENRLLWHMPLRRLEAEEMSDSLLAIAGKLDLTQYGPPDELDIRGDGLVRIRGTAKGWRRAVYSLQKRKAPITLLESFDLPPMGPNCVDRPVSTVATQALHLLNDAGIRQLAADFAARVRSDAGQDRTAQIERACRLAWGRGPSAAEAREAVASLAELETEWRRQGKGEKEASQLALADYCLALFNSAAFLYID